MNLRLPTRFVMLDKAIATLGSVGIELYPDFNVFEVAKPYARSLHARPADAALAREAGAARAARSSALIAAEFPYQVHDVMEELRDGQIEVGFVHKGLDEFMARLSAALNRLVVALVVVGRPDRLEPDRDLRDDRPSLPRREHHLRARLRALRPARRLAPLGSHPLRPALDRQARRAARARGVVERLRTLRFRSPAVNGFWM